VFPRTVIATPRGSERVPFFTALSADVPTRWGLPFFDANLADHALAAPTPTDKRKVVKSAILIWLSGDASHIDTCDMKPDAPAPREAGVQSRPLPILHGD